MPNPSAPTAEHFMEGVYLHKIKDTFFGNAYQGKCCILCKQQKIIAE